ncbi:FAD-binding domain-containing protein [Pseudaestuariivita sp.]|uniref:FAD-binding domain-containing protein n=1 Tax=Pseudaestuariivita sp. TaxID=2211669 RepID=UPI0040596982
MTQSTSFDTTREAGLARLTEYLPKAGAYARLRNFDLPGHPHVSQLSPYIRHRLVTEAEVLSATLDRYAPSTVEKFIHEVFWRTYWKGWMEMRPSVWDMYQVGLKQAWNDVQTSSGLRQEWEAACKGETGIACFDHWARELAETGYLHNHARMWFASIWIYTLRLPWELGTDFFLRHLLDGDPASNTLGWRWVGGLHTPGKTYLARADNIRKYTEGRFDPQGQLAAFAVPLDGAENPPRAPLPEGDVLKGGVKTGVLLTYEDCTPSHVWEAVPFPDACARLAPETQSGILHMAPLVVSKRDAALDDAVSRWPGSPDVDALEGAEGIVAWAKSSGLSQVVTSYPPVGPVADVVRVAARELEGAGVAVTCLRRDYDSRAWPHATAGFFKFKTKIPKLLDALEKRQMSLSL